MKKNKLKNIGNILLLFIILFIILLIIHKCFNIGPSQYYFDVNNYNAIGKSLFEGGHFNIFNIVDDFRGFVFPTFMGFCGFIDLKFGIANSMHIISSVILSILLTVYLCFCKRFFYEQNKKEKNIFKFIRYLIPIVLLGLFFYGLIIYPLTDLYSALLCIDAAFIIWSAFKDNKIKKIIKYFFAGFLLYLTYNIRTIYQLSLIIFLIYIIICELKNKKIFNTIICSISYILGAGVAAIPQFIINFSKYKNISPWINTNNLFGQQLFWGLSYNRYATFIGSSDVLKPGGMYFIDHVGMRAAIAWQTSGDPLTILNYIKLFFQYPIEFISMGVKHIFNSFFIIFPEQYIKTLDKNFIPLAILSLLVIFLFFIFLFIKFKSKKIDFKKMIFIIALIFPSVAIMLGAVEERFLILPYLLIYGFIAFFDFKKVKKFFTKKKIICVICIFFVFAAVSLTIESDILDDLIIGENEIPLYLNNR